MSSGFNQRPLPGEADDEGDPLRGRGDADRLPGIEHLDRRRPLAPTAHDIQVAGGTIRHRACDISLAPEAHRSKGVESALHPIDGEHHHSTLHQQDRPVDPWKCRERALADDIGDADPPVE